MPLRASCHNSENHAPVMAFRDIREGFNAMIFKLFFCCTRIVDIKENKDRLPMTNVM